MQNCKANNCEAIFLFVTFPPLFPSFFARHHPLSLNSLLELCHFVMLSGRPEPAFQSLHLSFQIKITSPHMPQLHPHLIAADR